MKHLTKLIILCCLRNRFIDNLCFHCKSPIHDYVKLQQYMSIIPLFVVAQSFVLIVSPSKLIFLHEDDDLFDDDVGVEGFYIF